MNSHGVLPIGRNGKLKMINDIRFFKGVLVFIRIWEVLEVVTDALSHIMDVLECAWDDVVCQLSGSTEELFEIN